MSVLVDTSAWIESFRISGDPGMKRMVASTVQEGNASITGIIVAELLRGAKERELAPLQENLSLLQMLPTTDDHYIAAGILGSRMRRSGHTLPTADLLIATIAIAYGSPLLCRDRHFDLIAEFAELRIYPC
jgi:predicted nucleic acid-binding protein